MTNKRIAFIAQPEYFRFTYETDLDKAFDVKEFKFSEIMTNGDWSGLLQFQADYNIFFHGETFPNTLLEQLNGKKINLSTEPFPRVINSKIQYTRDSINRYRSFRRIREKKFDYVFHYDKNSFPIFERDGLKLSGEFVLPVATGVYQPKDEKKVWDLFFVGRSTEHREKYFGFLKYYYDFLHIAHGIWGPDLVKYLCASRICLNVHAENEISWEPRLQMMLACGAFVISEPISSNEYIQPGVDYVEVTTEIEMREAVDYYLAHEEERNGISRNAAKHVRDLFDSKSAFTTLIEKIETNQYQKFEEKQGAFFWNAYNKLWEVWHQIKKDHMFP